MSFYAIEFIEVKRDIDNPKNSTYRNNSLDYDTDMLREFKTAIDTYLKTWEGEMEVLGCLKLVKAQTKSGAEIDLENFGEDVEAQVKGVEGAEDRVTVRLRRIYRLTESELLENPAEVHPKLLERQGELLSVLKENK